MSAEFIQIVSVPYLLLLYICDDYRIKNILDKFSDFQSDTQYRLYIIEKMIKELKADKDEKITT